MLFPRLAAIAVLIICAITFYITSTTLEIVKPVRTIHVVHVLFVFTSAFGIVAGLGGIAASFVFERVGPDCFKPKDTQLGQFLGKMTSGTTSFCEVSTICGIMLAMVILCSAVATLMVYVSFIKPESLLIIFGTAIVGSAMYWFGTRYTQAFAWTIVTVLLGGLTIAVVHKLMTQGVPKAPMSFDELVQLVTGYLVAGAFIGMFYAGKWLLQKMRFYSSICPTRIPEPKPE